MRGASLGHAERTAASACRSSKAAVPLPAKTGRFARPRPNSEGSVPAVPARIRSPSAQMFARLQIMFAPWCCAARPSCLSPRRCPRRMNGTGVAIPTPSSTESVESGIGSDALIRCPSCSRVRLGPSGAYSSSLSGSGTACASAGAHRLGMRLVIKGSVIAAPTLGPASGGRDAFGEVLLDFVPEGMQCGLILVLGAFA
jgi:hypothetical protein